MEEEEEGEEEVVEGEVQEGEMSLMKTMLPLQLGAGMKVEVCEEVPILLLSVMIV